MKQYAGFLKIPIIAALCFFLNVLPSWAIVKSNTQSVYTGEYIFLAYPHKVGLTATSLKGAMVQGGSVKTATIDTGSKPNSTNSYSWPDTAVDSQGNFHLVYIERDVSFNPANIYNVIYRQFKDISALGSKVILPLPNFPNYMFVPDGIAVAVSNIQGVEDVYVLVYGQEMDLNKTSLHSQIYLLKKTPTGWIQNSIYRQDLINSRLMTVSRALEFNIPIGSTSAFIGFMEEDRAQQVRVRGLYELIVDLNTLVVSQPLLIHKSATMPLFVNDYKRFNLEANLNMGEFADYVEGSGFYPVKGIYFNTKFISQNQWAPGIGQSSVWGGDLSEPFGQGLLTYVGIRGNNPGGADELNYYLLPAGNSWTAPGRIAFGRKYTWPVQPEGTGIPFDNYYAACIEDDQKIVLFYLDKRLNFTLVPWQRILVDSDSAAVNQFTELDIAVYKR